MSAHTAGPWVAEFLYMSDRPQNACVVIHAAPHSNTHSGTRVGEAEFVLTPNGYHISDKGEAEANARLMAAAPDLLAALVAVKAHHEYEVAHGGQVYTDINSIDAAIAKATGGDA